MSVPEIFDKVCAKNGWKRVDDYAEIQLDGGRAQKVFFDAIEHEGDALIRAHSRIGGKDDLSEPRLRSALNLNFNLPHGAFALTREHLVLTETFLLKELDDEEIEAGVLYIAKAADRYEGLIYGTDEN